MVRDVRCKDGIYAPNTSVSTHHLDPFLASSDEWCEEVPHTFVEQAIGLDRPGGLGEAVEFGVGYVPEEDSRMHRRLTSNRLGDIADGEVHWPGLLVTREARQDGFVRGEDDRGDRCTRGEDTLLKGESTAGKQVLNSNSLVVPTTSHQSRSRRICAMRRPCR